MPDRDQLLCKLLAIFGMAGAVLRFRRAMDKVRLDSETPQFERRRRQRRARMILELTSDLIQHDTSLTHREARCLVDCARRAIDEIAPDLNRQFVTRVAPDLDRIILERWPAEETHFISSRETIN